MAGRSPSEAVDNYVEPLQRALSCISSTAVLGVSGGHYVAETPHALKLYQEPAILAHGLGLTIRQEYRIVQATGDRGPWKVSVSRYIYILEDADGREILSYQWHPSGPSAHRTPHLHIGAGAQVGESRLRHVHLPTARVSVEALVRMLIEDFDVPHQRGDWERVLRESEEKFEIWRTWASTPPP